MCRVDSTKYFLLLSYTDNTVVSSTEVLSALTCGAMTDHHSKMKAGGLFAIERDIVSQLDSLAETKKTILHASEGNPSLELIQNDEKYETLIEGTRKSFEKVETDFVKYSFRRILCVSQVKFIVHLSFDFCPIQCTPHPTFSSSCHYFPTSIHPLGTVNSSEWVHYETQPSR